MKNFLQFISESTAVQQAKRLGLQGDGHGGWYDRKRKLLEKQKKGKARSKQFGRVEIPQEAFIGVLKIQKE